MSRHDVCVVRQCSPAKWCVRRTMRLHALQSYMQKHSVPPVNDETNSCTINIYNTKKEGAPPYEAPASAATRAAAFLRRFLGRFQKAAIVYAVYETANPVTVCKTVEKIPLPLSRLPPLLKGV